MSKDNNKDKNESEKLSTDDEKLRAAMMGITQTYPMLAQITINRFQPKKDDGVETIEARFDYTLRYNPSYLNDTEVSDIAKKIAESVHDRLEEGVNKDEGGKEWRKIVLNNDQLANTKQEQFLVNDATKFHESGWKQRVANVINSDNPYDVLQDEATWKEHLAAFVNEHGSQLNVVVDTHIQRGGDRSDIIDYLDSIAEVLEYTQGDSELTLLQNEVDIYMENYENYNDIEPGVFDDCDISTGRGGTDFNKTLSEIEEELEAQNPTVCVTENPSSAPEETQLDTFWLLTGRVDPERQNKIPVPGKVAGIR